MIRPTPRWVAAALTLGLLVMLVTSACTAKTVTVKSGERVVCTYGEEVSSSVKAIQVPAKDAGAYSVTVKRITCARHLQLQQLYGEAQNALGTQDFKTAQEKLSQVVKLDATYKLASQQLKEIEGGGKPKPDPSTGGTGSTDPDGQEATGTPEPEGPIAALLVYAPDSIEGFRARPVAADVFSLSRMYLPESGGSVASLVIVAEQHHSDRAAVSWLAANVKQRYTQSARNVRIGDRQAYLGTDGSRFAIIGWTVGPVTVAIEVDAGSSPSGSFDLLERVATQVVR